MTFEVNIFTSIIVLIVGLYVEYGEKTENHGK